jgi:mRNA interferase RelE/StbE
MPQYKFTPKALKQMQKFDIGVRRRIFKKLDYYMSLSDPLEFAEPISDPMLGQFRLRIGGYRVIFDVEKDLFRILKVGSRKDVYR